MVGGLSVNKISRKIFFITSTLPKVHGGRTKSLLQRARLLNESMVDVSIISTNYNSEYQEIYNFFRKTGKVLKNTYFYNIYDYYKKLNTIKEQGKTWQIFLVDIVGNISNYTKVKRSSKSTRTYFYLDGIPKFVIKYTDTGQVDFFALYREWNFEPYQYFYVNQNGFIHKITEYNELGDLIEQKFLTEDGTVYLTKNFDNKNTTYLLEIKGQKIKFSDEKKFISYYFNEIFTKNDVVINDARLLDKPLLESPAGKKIFQLHNSHLSDPTDNTSGIKNSFKSILNDKFPDNGLIITLTDNQKSDIVSVVPNLKDKIKVIPHSITQINITTETKENHFGVICRLHPQKNLKDTIKAFYLFDKEVKGYYLDIFGDGESRHELEMLVEKLNLTDQVIFHGNVQNVNDAYQMTSALLVTSNFEGFALNVLEAIANGTPVITYAVNYGPTDIIDETSGWVAVERTPESLKNQMIMSINHPKQQYVIQERSKIFSEENFVSKWLEVIEDE